MAIPFLDPNFNKSLNQKFRQKRFAFFEANLKKINNGKLIKILDIGGIETYWKQMGFEPGKNIHITLLNLDEVPVSSSGFTSVKGDACDLSLYADGSFDIVFSNSVIEHLYSFEKQKMMASEVIRVGKNYYIQTPNFWFPLEPHWLFPFFQFFPFHLKIFLTKHFNLGHYPKTKSTAAAVKRVKEVRLLTANEMKQLFPDAKLYKEYFLGLLKSITMYRF